MEIPISFAKNKKLKIKDRPKLARIIYSDFGNVLFMLCLLIFILYDVSGLAI